MAPLAEGNPRVHRPDLEIRLPGPVAELGRKHRLLQLLETLRVAAGGVELPAAGGAQAPGEHQDRFGLRELVPREIRRRQLERRRLLPVVVLQRDARRDRGQRVSRGEVLDVHLDDRRGFVRHFPRRLVLPHLQLAEHHVVHRVQRVVGPDAQRLLLQLAHRRAVGGAIAFHQLLPESDPREDVRGHVQRVRHRGRDAGVHPRRRQTLLRQLGVIVGVDQVVRHAGVLRVLAEQRFENSRRLELVGKGLVGGQRGGVEQQGVEHLGFHVLRVALGDALHRLLPRHDPRAVIHAFPIPEERAHCLDVFALAGAAAAQARGFDRRRGRGLHGVGIGGPGERVTHRHERDAPVGHGAFRVVLQHTGEGFLGGIEPERVEQRHPPVELLLGCGVAGHREADLAEFFRGPPLRRAVVLVGLHAPGASEPDQYTRQ